MKSLIFYFFLGISPLFAQNKTHLRDENIKGNVKSIAEYPYNAIVNNGKIEKGSLINNPLSTYKNEIIYYNSEGYIIKKEEFELSKIKSVRYYTYNENNLLVEDNEVNTEGKSIYRYTYLYDNKNRLVEELWFLNDVLYAREIFSYFPKRRESATDFYMERNKYIAVIEYDDNNNEILLKKWNKNGILVEQRQKS